MNPLDLRGPEFLFFYAVVVAAVTAATWALRRALEPSEVPEQLGDVDPYLVAALRGGASEAVRVATLSLLDRGLITITGDDLEAKADAVQRVRRPLERKILEALSVRQKGLDLLENLQVKECLEDLERELERLGLVPTFTQRAVRVALFFTAMTVTGSLALMKISVALSRGHRNISFLVVFALLAVLPIFLAVGWRRTAAGNRGLADLKMLFTHLKERASLIPEGGGTNELALLAGIYGLAALEGTPRDWAQALFPKATSAAASDGFGSSSSCGSSCSSSCGSSCGGGCGGGCGGCGS